MTFRTSSLVGLVALPLIAIGSGGCAALPLAMLGSALGLATSAAGAGSEVYRSGKLDSAEAIGIGEACEATVSATLELALRPTGLDVDHGQYVFHLEDDQHAKLTITLDPRTENLTSIRIDVGLFGSEPMARLFLQRLRAYVASPGDESQPDEQPTLASNKR